ncbi:hypothetical protein FE202_12880, partial [Bacillus subtilis]|uniref:hypothetical protein n=1 Tax=Bacillus subtilis TaxID=1423 RepID=UPI001BA9F1AC
EEYYTWKKTYYKKYYDNDKKHYEHYDYDKKYDDHDKKYYDDHDYHYEKKYYDDDDHYYDFVESYKKHH